MKINNVCFICLILINSMNLFSQNKFKNNINRYNSDKKQQGKWVYYYNKENKIVQSKGRYKNGKPVGRWIIFNEEGRKYIKKRYFGKRTHEVWFYKNGIVDSKGWSKLILDDPVEINYYWDGRWKFYNEKGKLVRISVYNKGFEEEVIKDLNKPSKILSEEQLSKLLEKPTCLEGYWPNQSGPLSRLDLPEDAPADSTFTTEKIKIPSDSLLINGWLYLPLGNGKHPLVILTNGGGDDSRPIKSLSDWLAPILAHCGIAAFVHDKRGTGESEGEFAKTTYDDYVTDAGNCALYLSNHPRIDSTRIGVIGGSEGGRIAVLTASRFSVIKFVISYAGTVVSAIDDRINAQKGWLQSFNLNDTAFREIMALHEKSIRAWASNNMKEHEKVNKEIFIMRKKYDRSLLPFTKQEMDSIPDFVAGLPTWYSLSNDYLTELRHFNKKWLALFGEIDEVVPTEASVRNMQQLMSQSGNTCYTIGILPDCGHAPVNRKTNRMVRLDNIVINWLNENILNENEIHNK